jgi:hypothetical protein
MLTFFIILAYIFL